MFLAYSTRTPRSRFTCKVFPVFMWVSFVPQDPLPPCPRVNRSGVRLAPNVTLPESVRSGAEEHWGVAFPVEAMLRICYSPSEDGWGRYSWEHAAPRSSLPTRRTSPRGPGGLRGQAVGDGALREFSQGRCRELAGCQHRTQPTG
jgi:hypothetical protein